MGLDHAVRWGGALLTTMAVFATGTAAWSMHGGGARLGRFSLRGPAVLMLIGVGVLAMRPPLWLMFAAGVLPGIAYGRFAVATRVLSSTWPGPPGRTRVLSALNNVGNYGSLLVYALLALLSMLVDEAHPARSPTIIALIAALMCMAFALGRFDHVARRVDAP